GCPRLALLATAIPACITDQQIFGLPVLHLALFVADLEAIGNSERSLDVLRLSLESPGCVVVPLRLDRHACDGVIFGIWIVIVRLRQRYNLHGPGLHVRGVIERQFCIWIETADELAQGCHCAASVGSAIAIELWPAFSFAVSTLGTW